MLEVPNRQRGDGASCHGSSCSCKLKKNLRSLDRGKGQTDTTKEGGDGTFFPGTLRRKPLRIRMTHIMGRQFGAHMPSPRFVRNTVTPEWTFNPSSYSTAANSTREYIPHQTFDTSPPCNGFRREFSLRSSVSPRSFSYDRKLERRCSGFLVVLISRKLQNKGIIHPSPPGFQ